MALSSTQSAASGVFVHFPAGRGNGDASAVSCIPPVDSRETDPLACLQPLIAIIIQGKQSIHLTVKLSHSRYTPAISFLLSYFLALSSFNLPLSKQQKGAGEAVERCGLFGAAIGWC